MVQRVRSLLDKLTDINKDEVLGVCQHCKRLNIAGNCKRCQYFIDKFKSCKVTEQQQKQERFTSWLQKVNELVQAILERKNVSNKLYDQPSPSLDELEKLRQQLKSPFYRQQTDISKYPQPELATDIENAKKAPGSHLMENEPISQETLDNNIKLLEELLSKIEYDTDTINYLIGTEKTKLQMECGQSAFLESLIKNKEVLEDLLSTNKYDTNTKLFADMLKFAIEAKKIGQFISMETLSRHNEIVKNLTQKIKNDKMALESLEREISSHHENIKMMEELLTNLESDADDVLKSPEYKRLKFPSGTKIIYPKLEYGRSTFLRSLGENKDVLKDLLLKNRNNFDTKLLMNVLDSTNSTENIPKAISIETLSRNKEIVEELLHKMKNDNTKLPSIGGAMSFHDKNIKLLEKILNDIKYDTNEVLELHKMLKFPSGTDKALPKINYSQSTFLKSLVINRKMLEELLHSGKYDTDTTLLAKILKSADDTKKLGQGISMETLLRNKGIAEDLLLKMKNDRMRLPLSDKQISFYDKNITVMEELLTNIKHDTDAVLEPYKTLKGPIGSDKTRPKMEYSQSAYLKSLEKNQKKLENLLHTSTHESDTKLLANMLKTVDDAKKSGQVISEETLSRNKEAIEDIIHKMKIERMKIPSSHRDISSHDKNIKIMEELLSNIKYDTNEVLESPKTLKVPSGTSKTQHKMEYGRSAFMKSLVKKKEKLEKLLNTHRYDTDTKLLGKTLKSANSITKKSGQFISMEKISKNKEIVKDLLHKMKTDETKLPSSRRDISLYNKDIKVMEELLNKIKNDTDKMLHAPNLQKYSSGAKKTQPRMEYGQSTFLASLHKNKETLNDLLLKQKLDTDKELLANMLKSVDVANNKSGQFISMENLSSNKKIVEKLLYKMKHDKKKLKPQDENLRGNEIKTFSQHLDENFNIPQSKFIKKENRFEKFIKVMSHKDKTKTEHPVSDHKTIKREMKDGDRTQKKNTMKISPGITMGKSKRSYSANEQSKKAKKIELGNLDSFAMKHEISSDDPDSKNDIMLIKIPNKIKGNRRSSTANQLNKKAKKLTNSYYELDSSDNDIISIKYPDSKNVIKGVERQRIEKASPVPIKGGWTKDGLRRHVPAGPIYFKEPKSKKRYNLVKFPERKRRFEKLLTTYGIDDKEQVEDEDDNTVKKNMTKADSKGDGVPKSKSKIIRGVSLVDWDEEEKPTAYGPSLPHAVLEFNEVDQTDLPPYFVDGATIGAGNIEDTKDGKKKSPRSAMESISPSLIGGRGFLYQLSDRKFITNGWTVLPSMKTMRKIKIFKMEPAFPQFDWFERNKKKQLMFYDTGERLAEFQNNGDGSWFYKNGEVALDFFYTDEECSKGQRYVVYSCGGNVDMGKTSPRTVLASFDYRGNGVVYDADGNVRLKYNQFEGILHDKKVGPLTRWKWHSLNEPPQLNNIIVENYVKHFDPCFENSRNNLKQVAPDPRANNEIDDLEMLALEYESYAKADRNQKFQPYKIQMKTLKINDTISLRVFDQANIYLLLRDGPISLKLNVGMKLLNEVIDVETIDTSEVMTPYDHLPPLSQSVANIQNRIETVRKAAKIRDDRTDRIVRPPKLSTSAYKIGIGIN